MKKAILFVAVSAFSVTTSNAVILLIGNSGSLATANAVVNSSGNTVQGSEAFFRVGRFDDSALGTATNVGDFLAAFTEFGSGGEARPFAETTFPVQAVGLFNATITTTANPDFFNGQNIDIITFTADQSEALIVRLDNTFESVAEPANIEANMTFANSTILFGGIGPDVVPSALPGATANPTFQMAVIPEPSSALLFAGSLTLLGFRRRRA